MEVQYALAIIAFDGEDLSENGLEPQILPFGRGNLRLEEFLYELVCNSIRFGGR